MNYKYLKLLLAEYKKDIERWKKYCNRQEKLLLRAYEIVTYLNFSELKRDIEKILEEDNVR